MQRKSLLVRLFAVVTIGVVAGLVVMLESSRTPISAAPHTITPVPHPFDPDWLEVKIIIEHKCMACHRADLEERVDLSSYQSLIAAKTASGGAVIKPGNPSDSVFWEYVAWNAQAEADCPHPDEPMMPKDRHDWLTAGQLEIVHRWIRNGALEYVLPDQCDIRPLMETDFPSAKQCAGCHERQYDQWARSMHAYAQHSPVFEAFTLTLVERTGGTIGTFCTRCHTPLGVALGETASTRNVHRSRLSMEGISCVVCHRRKHGQYKNNGRLTVQPGGLLETCMFGPFDDAVSTETAHASVGFPYIKSSQFCGDCHDVTAPNGVRNEEAFSEWANSPAAKQGITCQNCHMGPVQGIPFADKDRPWGPAAVVPGVPVERMPVRPLSDHTFAGPDYSLLPDTEFPFKLDWMYEVDYRDATKLTPYQVRTLDELRRKNRDSLRKADEKRYEVLSNAARLRVTLPERAVRGQHTSIRVDVESIFAGHSLPTGFTAERQVWVSIEVFGPDGQTVFASGGLDHNLDLLDEHSYDVITRKLPLDHHLMNFQNKFVALSNKGTERPVVVSVNRHISPTIVLRPQTQPAISFGRAGDFRIAKASLPPLKTLGHTYPVKLPDCPGPYAVRVKLNFRHLPPVLLDQVGVPHLKHLLEIVVLDEYESVLHVW
ncbi:MAG: multiheme c-type cytochrome [Planctomycetota bacterium]